MSNIGCLIWNIKRIIIFTIIGVYYFHFINRITKYKNFLLQLEKLYHYQVFQQIHLF